MQTKDYCVITGCGNPSCIKKDYSHVIDTIDYHSARVVASVLRNQPDSQHCPICGHKYGFYAIIKDKQILA